MSNAAKARIMEHGKAYTFDEIVAGNLPFSGGMRPVVMRIKCADGTSLSAQASRRHYCTPRHDYGPYSTLEVGYPSAEPPQTWRKYFDGDWAHDDHKGRVYARVPVNKIAWFIRRHGGEAG